MKFCINVENLENINFKKFCELYNDEIIIEKSDEENIILLKWKNKNIDLLFGIIKRDVEEIEEETEENLTNYEKVLRKCNYDLEVLAKDEKEVRLIYEFAIFLVKNNTIILNDYVNSLCVIDEKLKDIDSFKLDIIEKEYKVDFKYYPKIKDLKDKIKPFEFNGLFVFSLIISSIIASLLLIWMIEINITNILIISLPFIVVLGIHFYIPIKSMLSIGRIRKEIIKYDYEHIKEICKINNSKIPRKPSVNLNQKNNRQLFINICGFSIVPAIIIGSILIAIDIILLGIIIMLLPWLILIILKKFVTDEEEKLIRKNTHDLIKKYLNKDISKDAVGLKFELSEINKFNWKLNILVFKEIDLSKINKLDDNNKFVILDDLCFEFKCKSCWENIENNLIKYYILEYLEKIKDSKIFDKLEVITLGFNDGYEQIIYLKNKNNGVDSDVI